jgi:AcrR family transcriptional regulator
MGRRKLVENREEVILNAAKTLFQKFGFEKTTMDEIAQEAGIAKGSVYLDFPSKHDILISLIRQLMGQRLAEIQETIANTPQEQPRLDLLQFLMTRHAINVYDTAQESALNPEVMALTRIHMKEKCMDYFLAMRQNVANLIQEAMNRKEMPKGDAARQTELFMLGFSSVMPPYHRNCTREQHLHNIEDLISLLIAGLKQGIQPKGLAGCIGMP